MRKCGTHIRAYVSVHFISTLWQEKEGFQFSFKFGTLPSLIKKSDYIVVLRREIEKTLFVRDKGIGRRSILLVTSPKFLTKPSTGFYLVCWVSILLTLLLVFDEYASEFFTKCLVPLHCHGQCS